MNPETIRRFMVGLVRAGAPSAGVELGRILGGPVGAAVGGHMAGWVTSPFKGPMERTAERVLQKMAQAKAKAAAETKAKATAFCESVLGSHVGGVVQGPEGPAVILAETIQECAAYLGVVPPVASLALPAVVGMMEKKPMAEPESVLIDRMKKRVFDPAVSGWLQDATALVLKRDYAIDARAEVVKLKTRARDPSHSQWLRDAAVTVLANEYGVKWTTEEPAQAPSPPEKKAEEKPTGVATWVYVGGGVVAVIALAGGAYLVFGRRKNPRRRRARGRDRKGRFR